jgi:hypothetical protein
MSWSYFFAWRVWKQSAGPPGLTAAALAAEDWERLAVIPSDQVTQ